MAGAEMALGWGTQFDIMMRLCVLLGLVAVANAASTTLTKANFQAEVKDSGKNAFIKFQAPW